ncbi:MAG: GNAT family N-acetyltransferase [Bacteroidia bacterium]|nr:GNAT family N-acetyltransferase [Bacteroidia bacterium]
MKEKTKSMVVVDRIRPGEVEAAAKILADSFLTENLFKFMFEGVTPEKQVRATLPWFRTWISVFADQGEIHTARVDGQLAGVAIRMPPDGYPPKGLRKVRFMFGIITSVLRMAMTKSRALNFPKVAGVIEKAEPAEPFWHMAWIGVLPQYRGKGVGAALADESVRLINSGTAPGWFITFGPNTRALYERRGFVMEKEVVPVPGCPVMWSMRLDSKAR